MGTDDTFGLDGGPDGLAVDDHRTLGAKQAQAVRRNLVDEEIGETTAKLPHSNAAEPPVGHTGPNRTAGERALVSRAVADANAPAGEE